MQSSANLVTFGPNSDKGAMGYQSLVHLWPFKKKIGSLFIRLNDFQAFPIFFPKSRETRISVADARAHFVLDSRFSGGHKIRPRRAGDLIFFLKFHKWIGVSPPTLFWLI